MYGYVYLTENLITYKIYIGQHKSTSFDPCYHGSGKYLKRAIKKYGKENFMTTLVKSCNSRDELNEEEMILISKTNSRNPRVGYNITGGGEGFSKMFHSDETKLKISKKCTGYKHSDDARLKISNANKSNYFGCKNKEEYLLKHNNIPFSFSEESKLKRSAKIRESKIGDKNPMYQKDPWNKGQKFKSYHSEESKKKISIALKSRHKKIKVQWWTNGVENKMCETCPEEFVSGMTRHHIKEDKNI